MKRLMILAAAIASACTAGDPGLDKIHAGIASDMPEVTHITPSDFQALDPEDVILLDIREPDEYAVSRLPGAIRVSPKIETDSALLQIGDVTDKKVIVYCSVGRRSAGFADRVQDALIARGAVQVSNLEKGIFGWHNESGALENETGTTDAVHPYNDVWKRYVKRKDKAKYTPK